MQNIHRLRTHPHTAFLLLDRGLSRDMEVACKPTWTYPRRAPDSRRRNAWARAETGECPWCAQMPASLRSASALSVRSHVKAVNVSLFSTFLPPMNSFHL